MNIGGKYVATSVVDKNYQLYADDRGSYFGVEFDSDTGEFVSCFVLSHEWVAEHHPEYQHITLEQRLAEYEQLMESIHTDYQYGRGFVQACLIAVTTCQNSKSRNEYITCMGRKFSIPTEKVERVITLLPA